MMIFDIYGRCQVALRREDGTWAAYHVQSGSRRRLPDVVIPSDIEPDGLATYLDDLFHEYAAPGRNVERVKS